MRCLLRQGRIGVVHKGTSKVFGIIDNPSQFCRVVPRVVLPGKSDCLVEEYTILPFKHFLTVNNLEHWFPFLPNDEECSAEMYSEEPFEVEIPAVKYIAGVGFIVNPVHSLVVANFGVGDSVEYGDLSDDVNLCVYFDARLCTAEKSPSENRHAEIDDSGINGIESSVKFKLFGDSPMLGKRYHIERELLEDSRLSEHICLGKCVPYNRCRSKSKIVRPFSMGCSYICELSETSTSQELTEHKHEQMIPVAEVPSFCLVGILFDDSPELTLWQIHGDLREDVVSCMHIDSLFVKRTNIHISNVGHKFYRTNLCA